MPMTVKLNTVYGEEILEDVIEIHFNYASVLRNRIAFESIDTGCTWAVKDIVEFEAIECQKT